MKLSCTFYPPTLIKSTICGKILFKNMSKQAFINNFQFSKIFVEA